MIREQKFVKNGREIKKISLLFVDEAAKLCDACDEMKKCATLYLICNDTTQICKDCLNEIIAEF